MKNKYQFLHARQYTQNETKITIGAMGRLFKINKIIIYSCIFINLYQYKQILFIYAINKISYVTFFLSKINF